MGKVTIETERCKGCGYCVSVCKSGNLILDPEKRNRSGYSAALFLNEEKCTGCAICAEVCPDVALEVFR